MRSEGELMLGGLLRANHLTVLEHLPGVIAEHASSGGFADPMVYVTDLQQQLLMPLPGQSDPAGEPLQPLRIDATLAGRAFRAVEVVRARLVPGSAEDSPEPGQGEAQRWWVPLLDGAERVGVLGLTVSEGGELAEWRVTKLASLVAMLVMDKRPQSDSYARLVRTRPMTLSAEVLMTLLPPGTCANDDVVISAALEPAYEIGGDIFDYAIDGDLLHLAIFDAMGHDTSAALTATVAVSACRNNRRQGADLPTTGEAIDAAIADQFVGRFATGVLADLNLRTGWLSWVNRGHHPPLVLRDGRWVATLSSEPDPPMGFRLSPATGLLGYQLEPGDRVLFYTDGIIEAQSPDGEQFGLERFIDFIIRHEADGLSAPETLRRLIQAILKHQSGRLQDDATVLLVEWRSTREQRLTL
ncbi:PP2C family protein-serine/threonine phosphatase [Nonomuraea jiangxiensis]|uniref:Stage II sporulation protein E (SpoIIE) n=1 Tax=Nonomuraea jiangxiensis TaxID=633440 RepID=A0A1G9CBV9_9ACTN|nr:PP2C family protein-serine/threonine phosphatase [Nonomuraea jiangxiensis]SDK49120.1 Stage II sporulation protein E (SpoIIE) [Nonomuraea jiangxiensis]